MEITPDSHDMILGIAEPNLISNQLTHRDIFNNVHSVVLMVKNPI